MSTSDRDWSWVVPRTRIGKLLLVIYLVALAMALAPILGIGFDRPTLWGPFPEAVTFTYLMLAVMNFVLILCYVYLFRPWAEEATEYTDTWIEEEEREPTARREASGSVVTGSREEET